MQKKITSMMLGQGSDYRVQRYFMVLPKGWTVQDVFDPSAWAPVVQMNQLSLFDLVRVRAHDGAFDFQVTVVNITKGAANVEMWPKLPSELEAVMGERVLRVVPVGYDGVPKVRVEQQETGAFGKSVWRVIALNGEEISSHPTEPEALGAMADYLTKTGYRLPSDEEAKAMVAALEQQEIDRQNSVAEKKQRAAAVAGKAAKVA